MKRLALLSVAFALTARADEGMWTFDNFPAKKVRQKYGFSPDAEWLQEARLASVRLAGGGSGRFVSPQGPGVTQHPSSPSFTEQFAWKEKELVPGGVSAPPPRQEVRS